MTGVVRQPIAVGYIRGDLSGVDMPRHTTEIRLLAARLGYALICVVRLWPHAVHEPLEQVLGIGCGVDAAAIIVPDLAHVDNQPNLVCDVCDLLTVFPEETWAKAHPPATPGEPMSAPPASPTAQPSLDEHNDPGAQIPVRSAHRIMQEHKRCPAVRCPRKRRALMVLVEAGKLVPSVLSPRERAARRGIHIDHTTEDYEPHPSAEISTLRSVLARLEHI